MEIIFYAVVGALLMMLFFLTGMYIAVRMEHTARRETEYRVRKTEAYHLAGVERPGDPLPYVAPPVRVRRRRKIPYMKELESRIRSGGRGTVKVTGGNGQ